MNNFANLQKNVTFDLSNIKNQQHVNQNQQHFRDHQRTHSAVEEHLPAVRLRRQQSLLDQQARSEDHARDRLPLLWAVLHHRNRDLLRLQA